MGHLILAHHRIQFLHPVTSLSYFLFVCCICRFSNVFCGFSANELLKTAFCCGYHADKGTKNYSIDICIRKNGKF
jgi:hypothetical protein